MPSITSPPVTPTADTTEPKTDSDKTDADTDTEKRRLITCIVQATPGGKVHVRARCCEIPPGRIFRLTPIYLKEVSGPHVPWPRRGESIITPNPVTTLVEAHDAIAWWASVTMAIEQASRRNRGRRRAVVQTTKITAAAGFVMAVGFGAWNYWHEIEPGLKYVLHWSDRQKKMEDGLTNVTIRLQELEQQVAALKVSPPRQVPLPKPNNMRRGPTPH
jgi:hypothetical protein